MTFTRDLANFIANSGKKHFALGIVGVPYAGKIALARSLVDELASQVITAQYCDADEYYIEMAPSIKMRRADLASDIQEFKTGKRIFIGNEQIGSDTTVLIFTATLKFLPEDISAYNAFDFRVFSTFKDGRVRLDRKLRAEGPESMGKAVEEIIGEFTQEQLQEHAAINMALRADVVWCDDIQTAKSPKLR